MSKLDRTDGGLLTLGIIGALAAAGSLRRGSANDYNWQDDWKAIQKAYQRENAPYTRNPDGSWPQQQYDEDEEKWWDLQGQAISKRLGPNIGLGADWSVSAWHLGPGGFLTDERLIGLVNAYHMASSRGDRATWDEVRTRLHGQGIDPQKYSRHGVNIEGGQIYLLDNEDDTFSVVQRFYVEDDYAGISDQDRRDYADGDNDAIVELASFSEYPAFPQVMQWLDANGGKLPQDK